MSEPSNSSGTHGYALHSTWPTELGLLDNITTYPETLSASHRRSSGAGRRRGGEVTDGDPKAASASLVSVVYGVVRG